MPQPTRRNELSPAAKSAAPSDSFGLTRRELAVVRKIAAGGTTEGIAADLAVSGKTVDRHVGNILDKLGVSNSLDLVLFAVYHRLIDCVGCEEGLASSS